ncbi:MAG: hypothetical protein CVU17_02675 [Betaproteobacteria bacterium HGW-Betaproteobacteria-11]|nr:MAG: hypothetical protein CVU17_02675 [Betaproteobacteria bacterium HGW-Betaproteobacteria-11]
MIDILVYLFENYLPDACPPSGVLAKKLSAVGFESDEIDAALTWLDGLAGERAALCKVAETDAMRIFDASEERRLPAECRGFLAFLDQAEALDLPLREAIIERALALPDPVIGLDRLKVIVLAVIWRYRHEVDALILEELLSDEDEGDEGDDGAAALDPRLH